MNRYIIGSLWDRNNRNGANKNFEYLFEGRQKIDELNVRAEQTLTEAQQTNDMNVDVQQQIDNLILHAGESDAEVIQARGGFPLLKGRLDEIDKRIEELSLNIMEFEHLKVAVAEGYDWQPVFQAAVNYLHSQGGGKLYAPQGVYELYNSIEWETNISLFGAGMGKTILRPIGNTLSAIKQVDETKYNKDNPLEDVMFVDFEVDGTGFTNTTHSMAVKGLFILYMRRALFLNLYIHDTIGTGLGCDFLDQTVIHGCIVENNGRLYGTAPVGQNIGGAGIGVGTGVWETETLTISDCHAINCGSNGIFVEKQGNAPYAAKGIRIINCTSLNNRENGIEDKGVADLLVQGCTMQGNGAFGFKANGNINATGGKLLDNIIKDNTSDGVILGQLINGEYELRGNEISGNGGRGVKTEIAGETFSVLVFKDNQIHDNHLYGIELVSNTSGVIKHLKINDNLIYANGAGSEIYTIGGVHISSNVDDFSIVDNAFFDDSAVSSQTRGIYASNGYNLKDGIISNNTFNGMPLGIELLSNNEKIHINNNLGHETETEGMATFLDGEEVINVPHGLPSTPIFAIISERGVTTQRAWVRDLGTNNLVIKRDGTTGTLDVYWQTKI